MTGMCPFCGAETSIEGRGSESDPDFRCAACGVVVPWATSADATAKRSKTERRDEREEVIRLAREVYGEGVARYMSTPRRSLGMRTPAEAIADGDVAAVRAVLIAALDGFVG